MQAKQKVKPHFQLFTEGNTPFTYQPGDILCARFNTSFTKEDSPTSPTLPQQPFQEPKEDELVVLKKNSQNIEERLKKLSAKLYQKGVIQSEGLVNIIAKQTHIRAKGSIKDSIIEDKPGTDVASNQVYGHKTDVKLTSVVHKTDKENKDMDSSGRANTSTKKAKLLKEDPFRNNKLKSRFTPRTSMQETVTKSSISSVLDATKTPKSPIRTSRLDKRPSLSPRIDLRIDWHTRKGTLPSTSPSRTERIEIRTNVKEGRIPSVSPRGVPKTARDIKSSMVKQETKKKQPSQKEDDILVKVKIECYSPSRNGEKSPKSPDDLIKTLKMVRKFIDKSIGDDSKLKKLTALLSQQNPKAS